ncbi:HORMA domain-containing protein [Lipomyces orientalis]|uniref:HORMA domain-containing protein n=1 Tax=Lipomyces orientalis TaxID=1233043 RepID=A0ACC3TKP4_9ASCO
MAQLFRTEQALLQKSSTSQDIMTTPRQSQELVQTFISAAFGCLTFLRGLFSDDNYIEERFIGGSATTPLNPRDYVRLKKLKRGLSDQADLFLDWIERGIFDALEHKYLKAVLFGIYLDPRHPHDVAEMYTFNVAYREDNAPDLEITDDRGEKINVGVTYDDARKTLQQMMRRFITLTQTLPPLPDDRYLTIRLLFDDSCPPDYQPPGFKDATDDRELQFSLDDGEEIDRQDAGTLNAGWHAVSLKIASLPEREEYTQLLSQPHALSSQVSSTPKPRKKVRVENAAVDVEEPKWMAPTVKTRAMVLQDQHRERASQRSLASQTSQGQTRHALHQMFESPVQGETDTQTLSSQQVPSTSAPDAQAVSDSPSQSSKPASTLQPVQKPQSKSASKKPPKASTSKSSQKSQPSTTKKSSSPRKPLQPKPDSQLNARNSNSVTAAVEKLSLSTATSIPTTSARRDLLGSHNSFLDENDQSSTLVTCECTHAHDNFDLVQCNKCNSWKHLYCYGYSHVRDPALSDQFLCYGCRFARLSSQTIDKLKRLALFRCAVKVAYDTRRQFSSGPWKPKYVTEFSKELGLSFLIVIFFFASFIYTQSSTECTVDEVRPILRLLRREGVLTFHASSAAHRARKHSAAAIPTLVKTVAVKNAIKETYFDPSENVLVVAERLNAAMELLGDEDRGLIPSDDEDAPDSAMPDACDEPSQLISPTKKSPSKSRSATQKSSATRRPKSSTKVTTPPSSSSATSTPDVTISTAETTIIESEIQLERIGQLPSMLPAPTTCPIPVLPVEPAISGPPIEITDYVPRKRKISVVDEPLNPKY